MTELEINKTIHEARRLCWHEWTASIEWGSPICRKCDKTKLFSPNPSYTSSWSDYGQALEWAMKQEWWEDFLYWSYEQINMIWDGDDEYPFVFPTEYLNPLRGSNALAEFIVEHPEYFKDI